MSIVISIVLLVIQPQGTGQGWSSPTNTNGAYRTQVSATGHTPDGPTTTDLAVQCFPGKKGYLIFIYSVHGAREMKGFGLGDFEGPYAPTGNKRLTTITKIGRASCRERV